MYNVDKIITQSQWRAYLELCKPRVVALMLITVIVGMFLASNNGVSLSFFCLLYWVLDFVRVQLLRLIIY